LRKLSENYSEKRFPRRFLPNRGAPVQLHAECQLPRVDRKTKSPLQLILGKAFIRITQLASLVLISSTGGEDRYLNG
jgi:hypothetical protein